MAPVKTGAILLTGCLAFFGGAAGAGLMLALHLWWPAHPSETFAILFTGILAAVVGGVAVVAAIWGTISARKIARSQTTLEHIAGAEADTNFQNAKQGFALILNSGIDIARYADIGKEGDPGTRAIATVLNEYELISIGIQRGIIDPELYKRWSYSNVIFDWESVQPFVAALRKRTGRQTLFHEFEEMARWMSQNRLPHRRFWWAGV